MKERDLDDGRVNSMIGKALGLRVISPELVPYCAAIFFGCIFFNFNNLPRGLLMFACLYGFFWALVGNDPSKFFERLGQPKKYVAAEPRLDFNQAGFPTPNHPKQTTTTYRIKGKSRKYHWVEKKFHFVTYGQIELDGKKVGFHLLRRGAQLMFIFAWEVFGHDPSMTGKQAFSILDASNDALKGLPADIDLKCYQDITCSCEEYLRLQAELLAQGDRDPLSEEIIKSRGRRAYQLSADGRLLHNKITILAKYRVPLGGDYAVTQTWIDELLSYTQPLVGAVRGKNFDSIASWEKVLDFAYSHAYRKINFLLSDSKGFGLRVRTMNANDLFERDYLELHRPPAPYIPQYIVYNCDGLQDPVINDPGAHSLGVLFEPQDGYPATPKFDRHYAYLPVKNQYAAFIRLGRIGKFPPDKDNVARGYLRYAFNILCGTHKPIYNCRLVSELTPDRSGFEIHQLDRIISNSVKREAKAAARQTVDVMASRRREEALEARNLLEENPLPFWCSAGIWLYRESLDQLDQDISSLLHQLKGDVSVERVENNIEATWFQGWAFEWEALLTKPNHRRQKYLSFQALPLVPTIKVKSVNDKGVLLVTRELNSPLFLDIANKKNHTAIFAQTGTGKSNLMLDMIFEYILDNHLAVVFDFPRPDGSSTYTVLIPLLQELGVKAAYHNVRESTMNIVEMPDLRHVTEAREYKRQWGIAFHNQVELLCAIVVGTTSHPDEGLIKSLLTRCYAAFHADLDIKCRYSKAIDGGFGSAAYQNTPILEDFVDFAEVWFEQYVKNKKETISTKVNDTIDIIVTQLRGVLPTPLGASINGISSFDTNVSVLSIGLTNVSENLDTLIYAMAGLNVLFRGTMSSGKRSMLAIDEGTILYKFQSYARATGVIPVHGRKWGCNFVIAAQEIRTIMNSCSGNEIFKNLDNIFCGHLADQAMPEMLSELNFRSELLDPYSSDSFKPSPELLQSYWYLKRGAQHLEVTHPASKMTLALGATDPDEDAARKRVMAKYPNDKIAGLKEFASRNAIAKQQGLPMKSICEDSNEEKAA
jgi:Helicase HerA, central domain